jgi:predicted PurR-regulated permease PerM
MDAEQERDVPPPTQAAAALQVILVVVAAGAGFWILHRLSGVVLLLILAVFFAYAVAPLVQAAERPVRLAGTERRLPRGLAIGLVYLVILGSLCLGAAILLPRLTQQIGEVVSQAPVYAASLRDWEQGWVQSYQRSTLPVEVRQSIDRSVLGMGDSAVEYARQSLIALASILWYLPRLVLIPILAFFFLKDVDHIRRSALVALPHRVRLRGHRFLVELNTTLAAYIRAQLLACVLIGGICGLGFAVLGMPYPVLFGVLAGVLEFIPLVGPLLVAVVAVVIAALYAPILAVAVAAFLVVLRVIEDYVIYPRLIGRGIHLHPLAVVVAVLCGAELNGVEGIFLAIPVVAIASIAWRHGLEWRGSAEPVRATPRVTRAPKTGARVG